jgi:phosphoribosylformimino-5-aminoimidazole carboxamide ribotide isomerase
VLIPSIDVMGGKIVQLVQGKKKAFEFNDFETWVVRFSPFALVQLIDLDAAMGQGDNSVLIARFAKQLPCQVGGGIRSLTVAKAMIAAGARRLIIGSALIKDGAVNIELAQRFAEEFGPDRLVFAVDARGGKVAIRGWKEITNIPPRQMIQALDPFCSAFLYTHIDTEGLMTGLPLGPVRELRSIASKQLIVAGGISTSEEIEFLHGMGVDAVVGMAVYTGCLKLPYTIPITK